MSENTKRLSFEEWDELIQDYRNSGLSATKWCDNYGLKTNQLRWQMNKRQQQSKKENQVHWIPLVSTTSEASITVRIGNMEISVSEGFNKRLFTEVVQSLRSIC